MAEDMKTIAGRENVNFGSMMIEASDREWRRVTVQETQHCRQLGLKQTYQRKEKEVCWKISGGIS